ncbi:MAG: MFS transporter, partial [Planctomycetota bacterium]
MNSDNEKVGKRNLRTFCAGATLNDIGEEMYAPFLPCFATTFLGVTPAQYCFIEGITNAINNILRFVTGYFSDRVGRKIPVVLGYILIALSRLGLPLVKGWAGFIPFRGLRQVGRSLRDPAREACIAECIPQPKLGRAFGILNMVDTAGAILGPIIGLVILYVITRGFPHSIFSSGLMQKIWTGFKISFPRESYIWLFVCAALPTIISGWIIYLFLFETKVPFSLFKKTESTERGNKSKDNDSFSIFTFISSLKSDSPLHKLSIVTLSHMILALGAIPVSIILLYGYTELSASVFEGAILFIGYSITTFLTSYPAGWLTDRIGRFYAQVFANILLAIALITTILIRQPLLLMVPLI